VAARSNGPLKKMASHKKRSKSIGQKAKPEKTLGNPKKPKKR
jgi:hypothetical protein